jgi:uncharacterized protein (DUF736 family)
MKKSALIIGEFKKTETGFTGTLQTLATKADIVLHSNDDKQKDSHPDFIVQHGRNEIGVAWERKDDRGYHVSIAFEEPSLAAGYYTLAKSDKGISVYDLLYRKPMPKREGK